MLQTLLTKAVAPQTSLYSLGMRNVDELFPGFAPGDFAVIHGSPQIADSLSAKMCMRAQLPRQQGGLDSNVVLIDGGNTFRRYHIARLAQLHHSDPKQVLDKIVLSKAFTAYQITTLILEQLRSIVQRYNAKLVIISDIAGLFLDPDLSDEETRRAFSQIIAYLQSFARENQLVIVATYPQRPHDSRNLHLQMLVCTRANVVIGIQQTPYEREFNLEKHGKFVLGTAEYPSENLTLTDFMN